MFDRSTYRWDGAPGAYADEADARNGHPAGYANRLEGRAPDDASGGEASYGYSYADVDLDGGDGGDGGVVRSGDGDHDGGELCDSSDHHGGDGDDDDRYGDDETMVDAFADPTVDGSADDLPSAWQVPPAAAPAGAMAAAPGGGRGGGGGSTVTGWRGAVASFRTMPGWAQVAVPAAAVLVVLVAVGAAFAEPAKERAATDGPPTTATTEVVVTAETPRTTAAPRTTLPPPTTAATAPPTTAAPTTTTAAPPPPPPPTVPPTTAAAPTPQVAPSSCDPNYSGCVPVASDVDCAGGSGDGPEYVSGPITVTGSDPYDLDSDGDGVACE
jgi:hypothetical protein